MSDGQEIPLSLGPVSVVAVEVMVREEAVFHKEVKRIEGKKP